MPANAVKDGAGAPAEETVGVMVFAAVLTFKLKYYHV